MGKQCELGQSDDHTASLSTQCSVTPKRVEYQEGVGVYLRHADTQESRGKTHAWFLITERIQTTFKLLRPHSCTAYVGEAIKRCYASGKMAARKLRLQGRTFVTTVLALASVATFSGSFTVNKGILCAHKVSKSTQATVTFAKIGEYGRLGNQLFQIAATIGIAEAHSYSWGFYENLDRSAAGRLFALSGQLRKQRVTVDYEEQQGTYYDVSLPNIRGSGVLSLAGYFQDRRYFEHSRDTLRQYLQLPKELVEVVRGAVPEIESDFSIALHVRRGDYVKLQALYNVLDVNYYIRALDLVKTRIDNIIIVSDDISWCKEHLESRLPHKLVYSPFQDHLQDFVLLHLARTLVIANSSFSWWAAFLKHINRRRAFKHEEVRVFAPAVWYNQSGAFAHLNSDGFLPDEWVRVKV